VTRLALLAVLLAGCRGKPAARHDAVPPPPPRDAGVNADATADALVAKAVRVEHAVWSFVDNRASAHRGVAGELVVDGRGASFARYTRLDLTRWKLGGMIGNERAAVLDRFANLEVPIIPEQPTPTQVTARVFVADKAPLDLRVNGRRGPRVALEPGWQTVAVAIPRGAVHAGENVVALTAPKLLGLQWLRVGATHPLADEDPLAAAVWDGDGDAVELASGASLTWYVTLPEGAHVVADVAAPCSVEVGARATDASYAGGLLGGGEDRVDLSAMGGKTVRLSLTARDCPRARIEHARVTIHGEAPRLLPPSAPPRHVLLWHVRTLQGEAALDELARASVVFKQFLWAEPSEPIFTATLRATVDEMLAYLATHRDKPVVMYADTTASAAPELGRVIAQLKSWGIWDQTLLLVAAEDVLVVHDPARFPPGTLVDEGCDASDLVPTIRNALGQPASGFSLMPLAQGEGRGWPRPSFVGDQTSQVMRIGRYVLTVAASGQVSGELGPIERRLVTDAFSLFAPLRAQWSKATWGVVTNVSRAGARALDVASLP